MKTRIIGRNIEIQALERMYCSEQSEFVAVCGRRRVGKTFLVREYFEGKISFSVSGLANSDTAHQLENFRNSLLRTGAKNVPGLKTWQDAFEELIRFLGRQRREKKVVFLDELPWMDTAKSGFVSALEGFWNGWASARHDILLIVCGSATSWMMNKLINNHGGLHNRLTKQIFLRPFTLGETSLLLRRKGFSLSRYELAECYMVFGGIPYYLTLLDSSLSLAQNIDALLFSKTGELHLEFNNLYASLFKNAEEYIRVILALGKRRDGMTPAELRLATSLSAGGGFSTILANLEHCGFVRQYITSGINKKQRLYQLVDFFTLFCLHFMKDGSNSGSNFWQSIQGTARFYSWAGLSFELLALAHTEQIKAALGISGILSNEYACRIQDADGEPSQIDLLLDRQDNTISVCEAKFTELEYKISEAEEMKIRRRLAAVRDNSSRNKSLQMVLITTFGLANESSHGLVSKVITLEDMMK